jgi:hypothetical protein
MFFLFDQVFRFSLKIIVFFFPWNSRFFLSDQFSLLMYGCLLPSSATVKMDNRKNMENARYARNDDTAGFINQMKTPVVGNLSMI